jgi:hypothetical protein
MFRVHLLYEQGQDQQGTSERGKRDELEGRVKESKAYTGWKTIQAIRVKFEQTLNS